MTTDAVSAYARRVYTALAVMALVAAVTWPLWGMEHTDRTVGLILGLGAGVLRAWWGFFLAERLGAEPADSAARYASLRMLGLAPPALALVAGGLADWIDLHAVIAGVVAAAASTIVAAVMEMRAVERRERT